MNCSLMQPAALIEVTEVTDGRRKLDQEAAMSILLLFGEALAQIC